MQSSVDFWKKFFLKCFIITFALNVFFFVLWLLLRDFSFSFAHYVFAIDKATYNKMVLDFLVFSKYIMFYAFLTPALALYWISYRQKADWKKNIKLDEED